MSSKDYKILHLAGLKYLHAKFRNLNDQDKAEVLQEALLRMFTSGSDKKVYFYMCLFSLSVKCLTKKRPLLVEDLRANNVHVDLEDTKQEPLDIIAHKNLEIGINSLTKSQKTVILSLLKGNLLPELPGNYNTNKTHYTRAIEHLKEYF